MSTALPRVYWVIWSGTLLNRLGTMVQPFLAFYLTSSRGLSIGRSGLVMGVFGVGAVLSPLVTGPLVDRWERRTVLTAGMLLSAVAILAIAYTSSYSGLLLGMLFFGFVVDAYRPASSALIADVVPEPLQDRAFGLLPWAVNLGFTVGALAGGLLAREHMYLLFWTDAITCALFGALVWFAVPATPRSRTAASGSAWSVTGDRVMIAFCLVTFGYAVVYLQSVSTLPLHLNAQGLDPSLYGVLIAVNCVVLVVVQPLVAHRVRRAERWCASGLALTGLGFGATALVSSVPGYLLTVVVWTAGEILVSTVSLAIVFRLAPADLRGRYAGAYGFAWSLATAVAPVAGSQLLGVAGAAPWVACAGVCLVATLVQVRLGRTMLVRV